MNKIKLRGTSAPSCPTFLDRVVHSLFSRKTGAAKPTVVTESEVKIAVKKIVIRKAPGLDGVPGLAIKTF